MAQLLTNRQIDFRQFNLFEMVDQFDNFEFADNANVSVDSSEVPGMFGSYSAEDLSAFWTGADNPGDAGDAGARLYIAGNAFVMDENRNAVSGTVTGMSLKESYGGPAKTLDFYGFRLGAVEFQNAAITAGNADDIALLKKALTGADRITGSGQGDFAYGWKGNDTLFGNGGKDTLSGDAGKDEIRGGRGDDVLKGGTGNDRLFGDKGADVLDGGIGSDTLTGGGGADRFILAEGQMQTDLVTDFQDGLDVLVFKPALGGASVASVLAAAIDTVDGVLFGFETESVLIAGATKAEVADQIEII